MSDPLLSRRLFLADLGRGVVAIAIVGIAGCAPSAGRTAGSSAVPSSAASTRGRSNPPAAAASTPPVDGSTAPGRISWSRVDLGFVSAYVLLRAGEIAIVDAGVAGSEDEIFASISAIGLGWNHVAHVILTHKHPDHAGSIGAVLTAASAAIGYIGAPDLAAVQAPRPLTAVGDGDRVFGLRIVATPGHTAGHISVLDEAGGVLVAGDALGTVGGTLAGSNPQFTEDAEAARATVVKLGKLTFETLLVGHGEPILSGASAQVAALGGG